MATAERGRSDAVQQLDDQLWHESAPPSRHALDDARGLKIAYVCPRYFPHLGGIERHVERIATRMAAAGASVDVLTQERVGAAPAQEHIGRVFVRRFAMRPASETYPFAPGLFAHLAADRGYDIIHSHCYQAAPALVTLLQRRTPTVFTPHYHGPGHTPLASAMHRVYGYLGTRVMRDATAIICVSDSEAARVRAAFGLSADRIVVIPNGVEVQPPVAAIPIPMTGVVALTVGRLEPYKGVMELVEALPHLPEPFVLRVIGGGSQGAALSRRARSLNVEHRFELLGQVDDGLLQRWHQTASVYVTMSRHEAFGLGMLEAAIAGTPIVASDIPAHREVLSACSNARLIPPGAPPQVLAAAMIEAAHGERSVVASAATWDDVAHSTLAVYQRCLSQRGAR